MSSIREFDPLDSDTPPDVLEALGRAAIGIAGIGGIGSNIAVALTRAGARRLIVVDFDTVEKRNLNRQHYFVDQIGMPKVRALAETISRIDPLTAVETRQQRITDENACTIFEGCDVLVEALDQASQKAMLIEAWLGGFDILPVVGCSGVAGKGTTETVRIARRGRLTVVGDQHSELSEGTLSSRVGAIAMIMANEVVRILLERLGSSRGSGG